MNIVAKNPKDMVGARKWRQFFCVPPLVVLELGVAMLEGARKYGRANWTGAEVVASVYTDAAEGHILAWKMGRNIDKDSRLSELTKAMASLAVLRDAEARGTLIDDRMPHYDVDAVQERLQGVVDFIFEKHPNPEEPWTHERLEREKAEREDGQLPLDLSDPRGMDESDWAAERAFDEYAVGSVR